MARLLIVTLPITGHFSPLDPIARRLVQRGHSVWWYTGSRFQRRVESTGATYVPMDAGHDYDDRDLDTAFPGRSGLSDLGQVKFDVCRLFIGDSFLQLQDLRRFVADNPIDLIVADVASGGPSLFHELGGPPFASIGVTALAVPSRDTAPFGSRLFPSASTVGRLRNRFLYAVIDRFLFRGIGREYSRKRREIGLPSYTGSVYQPFNSPYLFLQPTVPEFEYPRSDLSHTIRFVGPLLPDPPAQVQLPDWWGELDKQTVVYVTQGTWAARPDELILPTMEALKHQDVLVVVTSSGKAIPADQIPSTVRIATFLPYRDLLPKVDLMVTNGGYGGVNFALAFGVPLVVAGTTEEKPEIASRVAWSGAGINLKTSHPTVDRLRSAVREVLANSSYRERARAIQASMARHDAPAESAALLEDVIADHSALVS